jgi:hypothetical protein
MKLEVHLPHDNGSTNETGGSAMHLCIVSRASVRSGMFITALMAALSPRDKVEIIVDRRRGDPATAQTVIERRHHSRFADALDRDGFTIVPMPGTQPAEHNIPAPSPITGLHAQHADEHDTNRILLEYQRLRKVRRRRWVVLTAAMGVTLVVLVFLPTLKTFMSRASADRMNPSSTAAPVPQVVESPSPTPEAPAFSPAPRVAEPPAPELVRISPLTTSSTPVRETRPTALIRPTTPAAATAPASSPRRTQAQAAVSDPPSSDADDPRAVVDWLLNR